MSRELDEARMKIFRVMKQYGKNGAVTVKNRPFLSIFYPVDKGLIVKTLYLLKYRYNNIKPGQKLVACGLLTPRFNVHYFPVSDFLCDCEQSALTEMLIAGIFKREYLVQMVDTRHGIQLHCNFDTGFSTQRERNIYSCSMLEWMCREAGELSP